MKLHPTPIILTLVAFIFSCKKETIIKQVQVPVVHSWSLDSSIVGSTKILLNAVPVNDSVLAVATRYGLYYVNSNQLGSSINGSGFLGISFLSSDLQAPSLDKYIAAVIVDSNHMSIFATYNSGFSTSNDISFTPNYSGYPGAVKGFVTPIIFPNPGYPIINSKYILAPVEYDNANQAIFNLITVNTGLPDYNTFGSITLTFNKVQNIMVNPYGKPAGFENPYIAYYYSSAFFNKFFVTYGNQFFRVDTLGNVKVFGSDPLAGKGGGGGVSQMFAIGNTLFAYGHLNFYVSLDQGESWGLFYNDAGDKYGALTFINLGSAAYAIYNSQIWQLSLSGNTINYQELDNDGLQTNQITSINKCGKYVFATTLSGLYYRDTASFNSPKK